MEDRSYNIITELLFNIDIFSLVAISLLSACYFCCASCLIYSGLYKFGGGPSQTEAQTNSQDARLIVEANIHATYTVIFAICIPSLLITLTIMHFGGYHPYITILVIIVQCILFYIFRSKIIDLYDI